MALSNTRPTRLVSETQTEPILRVLFFDHTAALGGGEIALANLVSHLDPKKITPIVVLGAAGPLADNLRQISRTYVMPMSTTVAKQKKDGLGFRTLFRLGMRLAF